MLEVIDELRATAAEGQLLGFTVAAEFAWRTKPVTIIRGRYRSDPYRALVALELARAKLIRRINEMEGEAQESMM